MSRISLAVGVHIRIRVVVTLCVCVCLAGPISGAGAIGIGIGGCSGGGKSFSWTGEGDGHNWQDAENWSPETEAPPKAGDSATIQGSEEHEAEPEGATGSICNLTVEGSDAFLTSSNLTIEGDLSWEGGQGTHAASELEGVFTVLGSSAFAHKLSFSQGTITTQGSLEVEGGTDLVLADESAKLIANGPVEAGTGPGGILGEGTHIDSNQASGGDSNAKFLVNDTLALDGDLEGAQLDLNLGPHGILDLGGHTLTLPGESFS